MRLTWRIGPAAASACSSIGSACARRAAHTSGRLQPALLRCLQLPEGGSPGPVRPQRAAGPARVLREAALSRLPQAALSRLLLGRGGPVQWRAEVQILRARCRARLRLSILWAPRQVRELVLPRLASRRTLLRKDRKGARALGPVASQPSPRLRDLPLSKDRRQRPRLRVAKAQEGCV